MTVERTLSVAHRLLRKGKINGAIAAYAEVLEERPDDWPAANRLGDLYMQTGQAREAVEQFTSVAQLLLDRELLPKASALYKKVLKIAPENEHARMQLVEIAERQGFLVDAKAHLTAVADQRRRAGDDQGAMEVERRVESLCETRPDDSAAAEAPGASASRPDGDDDQREINTQHLYERDPANGSPDAAPARVAAPVAFRPDPPVDDRTPAEAPRRVQGDPQATAPDRPLQLKLMLIESEIRATRLRQARKLVGTILADVPDGADWVVDLAKRMTGEQAEATVMCAEAILEAGHRLDNWEVTAEAVRELAVWVQAQPEGRQWPAALRQRLARAEAASRLETMRRESSAILEAHPDLIQQQVEKTPPPVGGESPASHRER